MLGPRFSVAVFSSMANKLMRTVRLLLTNLIPPPAFGRISSHMEMMVRYFMARTQRTAGERRLAGIA